MASFHRIDIQIGFSENFYSRKLYLFFYVYEYCLFQDFYQNVKMPMLLLGLKIQSSKYVNNQQSCCSSTCKRNTLLIKEEP